MFSPTMIRELGSVSAETKGKGEEPVESNGNHLI